MEDTWPGNVPGGRNRARRQQDSESEQCLHESDQCLHPMARVSALLEHAQTHGVLAPPGSLSAQGLASPDRERALQQIQTVLPAAHTTAQLAQ
jgi:hypothetical protein